MALRPSVLLFDIDGTLLLTGGAGRRAMHAAFTDVDRAHVPEAVAAAVDFPFAGMTDRAIVRAALRALARQEPDLAAIERVLSAYLVRLEGEVARSTDYRVLPGVAAIIDWLRGMAGVAIGLGTGNIRKGAYAKLARGSLDSAFAFGGFGCDAEDRIELLRVGAARGAQALGVSVEACRVVVIGDTPKDVAAARGMGAQCIGVGTGGFEPRALVELGAVCAFATLEDDAVRAALLG